MAGVDLANRHNRHNGDTTTGAPGARFVMTHRGWLLWGLGAIVLLALAVFAHGAAQFPGDAGISTLLQRFRGTPLALVLDIPSDVNGPQPGGVIAIAIIGAFAALRRGIEAIVIAVATFGADLINALINGVVARPRPHNVHIKTLSGLGAHSFPSGHVEHVTMLFGLLFFLTLLVRVAHPERWLWLLPLQVICVYFIAFVGVGRVVEGVHQPSDVLGGYLVAALLLPLALLLYRWLGRWWQRHRARRAMARLLHAP